MSITSLLAVDRVFTDADISSKKRLLEFIAEKAAVDIPISQDTIFNKLLERERLGSTGLGQGFAVPHARLDSLEETRASFVKLDTPINYDAMDHKPVDLIFVLLIPEVCTEEHLQILANLARIFSQPEIPDKIRDCQSAHDIIQLIDQAEQAVIH